MKERLKVIRQLFTYLWQKKKFWLFPIIAVMLILAVLIILGESAVMAPFIYSLF